MRTILFWLLTTSILHSNPNYFKVEGTSMYPSLKPGTTVLTDNSVTLDKLNNRDIIVFKFNNEYVIHRLIKTNNTMITKGDNNPYKDKEILNTRTLVGRVIKIY